MDYNNDELVVTAQRDDYVTLFWYPGAVASDPFALAPMDDYATPYVLEVRADVALTRNNEGFLYDLRSGYDLEHMLLHGWLTDPRGELDRGVCGCLDCEESPSSVLNQRRAALVA